MTGPELAAHLCTRDLSLPSFVDLCLVTAPRGSNCACAGTGVTLRHVSETSMLIVSLRGHVTKAAAVSHNQASLTAQTMDFDPLLRNNLGNHRAKSDNKPGRVD